MEFSYSQTENFEMEKLSSDTGYFKKPVEINRGSINFEEQYFRVLLFSVIFDLIIYMLPIANTICMYLIYRLKHGYGFCKNINPISSK